MNPNDELFPVLVRVITYALAEVAKVTDARDPSAVVQVLAPLHAEQQRALGNATSLIQTALKFGVDPEDLQARVQDFALGLMKLEMKFAHDLMRCIDAGAEDEPKLRAAH